MGVGLTALPLPGNITGVPAKRNHCRRLIAFSRQMRKAPTDAEQKLWSLLRRGKLNGHHFRRQVPIAGYIVDFCCLSAGLGIEADGGQHADPKAMEYDQVRHPSLACQGNQDHSFFRLRDSKVPRGGASDDLPRTDGPAPTLTLPRSTGGGNEECRLRCHAPASCRCKLNPFPSSPGASMLQYFWLILRDYAYDHRRTR